MSDPNIPTGPASSGPVPQPASPLPWEPRRGKADHVVIYVAGTNHDIAWGLKDADAAYLVRAANAFPAMREALLAFAPDDPFTGEPLSGGATCVGCGRDPYNAGHGERDTKCRWVRARAALAAAGEGQ